MLMSSVPCNVFCSEALSSSINLQGLVLSHQSRWQYLVDIVRASGEADYVFICLEAIALRSVSVHANLYSRTHWVTSMLCTVATSDFLDFAVVTVLPRLWLHFKCYLIVSESDSTSLLKAFSSLDHVCKWLAWGQLLACWGSVSSGGSSNPFTHHQSQ